MKRRASTFQPGRVSLQPSSSLGQLPEQLLWEIEETAGPESAARLRHATARLRRVPTASPQIGETTKHYCDRSTEGGRMCYQDELKEPWADRCKTYCRDTVRGRVRNVLEEHLLAKTAEENLTLGNVPRIDQAALYLQPLPPNRTVPPFIFTRGVVRAGIDRPAELERALRYPQSDMKTVWEVFDADKQQELQNSLDHAESIQKREDAMKFIDAQRQKGVAKVVKLLQPLSPTSIEPVRYPEDMAFVTVNTRLPRWFSYPEDGWSSLPSFGASSF